jgi:hypothetical protein
MVATTFASPAPAISIGAEAPIKHSPAINPNNIIFLLIFFPPYEIKD